MSTTTTRLKTVLEGNLEDLIDGTAPAEIQRAFLGENPADQPFWFSSGNFGGVCIHEIELFRRFGSISNSTQKIFLDAIRAAFFTNDCSKIFLTIGWREAGRDSIRILEIETLGTEEYLHIRFRSA